MKSAIELQKPCIKGEIVWREKNFGKMGYLVITSNKEGHSIEYYCPTKTLAEMRVEKLEHDWLSRDWKNKPIFFVKPFRLSDIDLNKLMSEEV